ncbi:hypothetical protein BB559_005697 [Furculomyces boomerangus]|uniref:Uncharacterized protein n=1 Tax=Furculomyces boomerangus TaxID=61424 RepID=A0A2T9Y754_9FUNG|nr:hypothetical protein BB559_005697 [Furculomyces boomerangus]
METIDLSSENKNIEAELQVYSFLSKIFLESINETFEYSNEIYNQNELSTLSSQGPLYSEQLDQNYTKTNHDKSKSLPIEAKEVLKKVFYNIGKDIRHNIMRANPLTTSGHLDQTICFDDQKSVNRDMSELMIQKLQTQKELNPEKVLQAYKNKNDFVNYT